MSWNVSSGDGNAEDKWNGSGVTLTPSWNDGAEANSGEHVSGWDIIGAVHHNHDIQDRSRNASGPAAGGAGTDGWAGATFNDRNDTDGAWGASVPGEYAGVDESTAADPFAATAHGTVDGGEAHVNGGDCYFCHKPGHIAKDCPNKPPRDDKCFQCGEKGHSKADCPKPPTCRYCHEEGHIIQDCPVAPQMICANCKGHGHHASTCDNKHKFDWKDLPNVLPGEAWPMMIVNDGVKDLDELREWIFTYAKAKDFAKEETTFYDLAKLFREHSFATHIIALEKDMAPNLTLIDLDGTLNHKYLVKLGWSLSARRVRDEDLYPKTEEENFERLKDAGMPFDRGLTLCFICRGYGHVSKNCKEDRPELDDAPKINCVNCGEDGHRARDCKEPRKGNRKPMECRNCGQEGHKKDDCTEPPNMDLVTCRGCEQTGHFAKDCPNKPAMVCHNCQKEGHKSAECTEPRVRRCRTCNEQGHKAADCPNGVPVAGITTDGAADGSVSDQMMFPMSPPDGGWGDAGATGNTDNWGETATTTGDGW